jgi:hypothetical protein
MKTLTKIGLCLIFAFSITSCGQTSNEEQNGKPNQTQKNPAAPAATGPCGGELPTTCTSGANDDIIQNSAYCTDPCYTGSDRYPVCYDPVCLHKLVLCHKITKCQFDAIVAKPPIKYKKAFSYRAMMILLDNITCMDGEYLEIAYWDGPSPKPFLDLRPVKATNKEKFLQGYGHTKGFLTQLFTEYCVTQSPNNFSFEINRASKRNSTGSTIPVAFAFRLINTQTNTVVYYGDLTDILPNVINN